MAPNPTQQRRGPAAPWDNVSLTSPNADRESRNQLANEARTDIILAFLGCRESRTVPSVALRSAPESGEDTILTRSITVKREPFLWVLGEPRGDAGVPRKGEARDGFSIWLSDRTDLCGADIEITSDGCVCSNCTIFRADDIVLALLKNRDNN
jgi:hypothetical protein